MAAASDPLTPENLLRRFLYTGTEKQIYITGDPETHDVYDLNRLLAILEMFCPDNLEHFLNIVATVKSEQLLPRPETLFVALTIAVCSINCNDGKHKIYTTLSKVIETSEDMCTFLKFYSRQQKKIGSGLQNVICSYYMKKDPFALAKEVGKGNGYHSWTHKNLLKSAHFKSESIPTTVVEKYILFGLEKAKAVAEGNSSATEIIDHLTKVHQLRRCTSENQIVELVSELQCENLNQISSYYHHSQAVWKALIPGLPIRDLISFLPKLHKLRFLKSDSPLESKIVARLTNTEAIQLSKIHAAEVFIGLRDFEKGGKPCDPQVLSYFKAEERSNRHNPNYKKRKLGERKQPNCPNIVRALYDTIETAFKNPEPTGKRFMISIDLTDSMQVPCLHNKNITCLDAAAILTLSLLKTERDVIVAVFNNNQISIVSLEKDVTFNQALLKLKRAQHGFVQPGSPFEWAMENFQPVDVFIHFIYNHHWFHLLPQRARRSENPTETLNKYQDKMSLPHTKLITFSLSSPKCTMADGSSNLLDVCGFSKEVPKVVEAFSKGLF